MKKIIVLIIGVVSVLSCMKNSGYSTSYDLVAGFSYENLKYKSDSTYYGGVDDIGLTYNYLLFSHKISMEGDFVGGFRLSCLEGLIRENGETSPTDLDMTWRVHSAPLTNSYMVFYNSGNMPDSHLYFYNSANGKCTLKRCFICNTAKVAAEIKTKFERGDKYTLKATGYLEKKVTGSAEIALADYTMVDKNGAPKDSIVSNWTMFDLSALGTVDEVRFEMTCNTKQLSNYFCLDNFMASISLEY